MFWTPKRCIDEAIYASKLNDKFVHTALSKLCARPGYDAITEVNFECLYNGRLFWETVKDDELTDHPLLSCIFCTANVMPRDGIISLDICCNAPDATDTRWQSRRFSNYMNTMWKNGSPF